MALTNSTGWRTANNGATLVVNVPGTRANSGRVRFRGITKIVTWSETSHTGQFPSPPYGFEITGGHAAYSATLTGGSGGSVGYISVSAPGGSDTTPFSLAQGQTQRYTASTDCYGYGSMTTGITSTGESFPGVSNETRSATTYAKGPASSTSPKITVGGDVITGASLGDGVVGNWYDIAAGLLTGGSNNILVNVDGSKTVDVEIEYTYEPYPPTPDRESPENQSMTDEPAVVFELVMRGHEDSAADRFHAKLRISGSPTMSDSIEADSFTSQVGWEYLDGLVWMAMPSTGVPVDTRIRYTLQTALPFGVYYWTVQPIDDWGYALASTVWTVRVVRSVVAQEGYSLFVEDEPYPCTDLVVNLTCNGKVGTITFVIPNWPDDEGIRNNDRIYYGDTVDVSIYDFTGAQMQYRGRVWQKTPGDNSLELVASLGDKILTERILKEDYSEQDIGTTMGKAIDTYCAPILSTGVPAPLGIIGNLILRGKPVADLFREIMKVWGLRWWVETDVVDWVCHVVDPTTLSAQGVIVRYGEGE